MQRHDEDYKQVISKLNGAFEQNKQDQAVNPGIFDKMDSEKQKLIEELPYEEIRKIGMKVHSKITDISYLTKEERKLLEDIREGRKTKYKQVVYRLTGEINPELIMKRYSSFVKSEAVFRTLYLYKGLQEPVRVVCENRESVFPIRDARDLGPEKQNFLLKNVLAAEMRREFDIEKDPVLCMQGYLTGEQGMMVVISIYPYAAYSTGIRAMMYKIFEGMIPQMSGLPDIDEKDVRKLNEKLRDQSLAYWKKMLLPLGRSLTIPGEKRETTRAVKWGKTFLYKELGSERTAKLKEFCEKNHTALKSVFLYAWGSLMGRYYDEKNPVLLVAQRRDRMDLFPVKLTRDIDAGKLCEIDRQMEESMQFSKCTVEELEKTVGISFSEYFRMVHEFLEFSELDKIGEGSSDVQVISGSGSDNTDINLFISYQMYDKNISMNYISQKGIMDVILENLHELFTEELERILQPEQNKFDKTTFITTDDSEEERAYKLRVAQIALYLKESGIFDSLTVEELMEFSEHCKLTSYLVNDMIVEEKTRPDSVYILGEGKLEESLTAMDSMVKTLRILKKGSVFGIESLFPEGEAITSFSVVSPQARVVEIEGEILKKAFRKKQESWIALLEKENEQKTKFQRLWTME